MRFTKGPDGGQIEHDNPSRKRAYANTPTPAKPPKAAGQMRQVTIPIKIAGAILRRVNRLLRSRGIRGVMANASFTEEGYHLHATVLQDGDRSHVAMFSEVPKGQYKVWP